MYQVKIPIETEEDKDPANNSGEMPHALSWFITTTFEGKFISFSVIASSEYKKEPIVFPCMASK